MDKKLIQELTKHYTIEFKEHNSIELPELGVLITSPYEPENCSGNEKSLPAVKKFVFFGF